MIELSNSFFNFVFDYIKKQFSNNEKKIRVLDFGCGDGSIVKLARESGYNFYGCDNFYGDKEDYLAKYNSVVIDFISEDGLLPYNTEFFDFIYSNQVFEHVKNLDNVLSELNRVLKRGGRMLHYFPTREYIVEGHFGVPLQHRLPRNRTVKKLYLKLLWFLGIGYNRESCSIEEWSNNAIDFVDSYCKYRSRKDILYNFRKYWQFDDITHQMINFKLSKHKNNLLLKIAALIPHNQMNYLLKYRGSSLFRCVKK